MNNGYKRSLSYLSYRVAAALVLFLILVLTADADAIGLYSVIARAAVADIHLVVLIPDEDAHIERIGADTRIRFTCEIDYRLPDDAMLFDIERRGLIVTDRYIGLVTVTGNRTSADSSAASRDTARGCSITSLRRIAEKRVRRFTVPALCCLRAIAAAGRCLIREYFSGCR